MPTHNTGGESPHSGARAMVETYALDTSSLGDGDLATLTLTGSGEQLITSDLESLVSIQAELDRYNSGEVDMNAGGDTLCVTVPSSESIEMDTMEIVEAKDDLIPECETQLVEFNEDIDMSEIDITTSVIEEPATPVLVESIQGHKIVQVQPHQQVAQAAPLIVSAASSVGVSPQSFVVIQSAPGSRVITTNAANQAKKGGQIVGRITGLSVGSSPQFQSMAQAITTARSAGGTVVQLRPITNSSPVQRPLAAKGATLTVGNLGARALHPQTSTPSRVTKVLLPRQAQAAGGSSVQHLVAIPMQKSAQANQQQPSSEQVLTVGHQTLRIVSGNVVTSAGPVEPAVKTQKKVLADAVESITLSPLTGAASQTIKPKQETVQLVQAAHVANKPTMQVARAINPASAPAGQIVNITVAQAQQMGLLSPGKLQQLMQPTVSGRSILVNKSGQGTGAMAVLQPSIVKSPTKILPAPASGANSSNVTLATVSSPPMRPLSLSPSKVIIARQAPVKQGSLLTTSTGQVIRLPAAAQTSSPSTAGVQPMHVTGRTMQYVRLVSIPSSTNTTATLSPAPRPKATSVLTLSSPGAQGQIKMIPIAPASGQRPLGNAGVRAGSLRFSLCNEEGLQVLPKSLLARTATASVPLSQASSSPATVGTTATQITDRTGLSNIVVLPPTFIQQVRPQTAQVPQQQLQQLQLQQQQLHLQLQQTKLEQIEAEEEEEEEEEELLQDQAELPSPQEETSPQLQHQHSLLINKSQPIINAKLMTEAILTPASPMKASSNSRPPTEPNGIRPRKPCNCTKSQCLKMYCDCFANGEFCHMCNCNCCFNNLEHEEDRQRAIKSVLERNPHAFRPKIGKGQVGDGRRHNKGCNCRRSGCLKNYCECYEAKIACSNNCKCVGCRNVEDMADGSGRDFRDCPHPNDLRINPISSIKKRQLAPLQDSSLRPLQDSTMNGFRQPFNFMTQEVVDATCHCLLAQAEKAEKMGVPDSLAEKLILEEFGRCLVQIIGCANRTDDVTT